MKKKPQIIKVTAVLTALALTIAGLTPQPAQAGDEEWATAGKILTGVVAGHILTHGLPTTSRRHVTVHETRVIRSHRRSVPRRCRPVWRPASRSRLSIVVKIDGHDKHHHGRGCKPHRYERGSKGHRGHDRHGHVKKHSRHPHRDFDGCGHIIHRVVPRKRLYQPRVHGHPAFIQVRRGRSGDWKNVRKHPSIW